MFLLKKTKVRIAYCFLAIASISTIAYDADARGKSPVGSSEAQRAQAARPPMPLRILPLAQSPFPEARPGYASPSEPSIVSSGQHSSALLEKPAVPSAIRFLTVPVKVDSGVRPVALNRGTKVHFIREQDGKFLVRCKGTDFLIEKTQVTDNVASLGKLPRNSS